MASMFERVRENPFARPQRETLYWCLDSTIRTLSIAVDEFRYRNKRAQAVADALEFCYQTRGKYTNGGDIFVIDVLRATLRNYPDRDKYVRSAFLPKLRAVVDALPLTTYEMPRDPEKKKKAQARYDLLLKKLKAALKAVEDELAVAENDTIAAREEAEMEQIEK